MEKKKIMFYADSFLGTSGYSKVVRELALRLAKNPKYQIYCQDIVTTNPMSMHENVIRLPIYGQRGTEPAISSVVNHIRAFQPHLLIPISDPFLLVRDNYHKIDFAGKMKLMPYLMLDSNGVPDTSEEILNKADKILTGSKHSKAEFAKEGYEAEVLYHGVNYDMYKPVTNDEKKKLQEKYNLQDYDKVFLHIGRHTLRKRLMRLIEAIALYNKDNPDNKSCFFIHSANRKEDGWNLDLFIKRMERRYDITIENIIFTEDHRLGDGINEETIVEFYQMCDFYISAASGEGFGLPTIEAMACKKVVILPDNSNGKELIGNGRGILVNNKGIQNTGYGTQQELVDLESLKITIEKAVNISTLDYHNMSKKANEWVKKNCDWNKITIQLEGYIDEVLKND